MAPVKPNVRPVVTVFGRYKRKAVSLTPVLETARLVLRPLQPDDLAPIHRIFIDLAVRRHLWDDKPVSIEMGGKILPATPKGPYVALGKVSTAAETAGEGRGSACRRTEH